MALQQWSAAERDCSIGRRQAYPGAWLRNRLHRAVVCPRRAPKARIDTIERDPEHARLARENFTAAGVAKRITVHEGDFAKVLPTLEAGYDVAFFDGNTPVPALHKALHDLLRQGGVLVTANLNHGGTANAVQAALFDGKTWLSTLIDDDGETAVSVKL